MAGSWIERRLARLEGDKPKRRLPEGCRTEAQWHSRLRRQNELQNACIRREITLEECSRQIRALGELWPKPDGKTPSLFPSWDEIRAKIKKEAEQERRERPADYEPGGPATLPRVDGGLTNLHYCRNLTPEESKLRAAWKAKHDPYGPHIREKLTIAERENEERNYRDGAIWGFGYGPEDAEKQRIEELNRRWAAFQAEKAAAPKEEPKPEPVRTERDAAFVASLMPESTTAYEPAKVKPRPQLSEQAVADQINDAAQRAQYPEFDRLAPYRGRPITPWLEPESER